MSARKICFDRVLPQNLHRQQPMRMLRGRARAIAIAGRQWVNGSTIQIRMNGGSQADRDAVQKFAPKWTEHANLHLKFTDDPRAEIRVTFDEDDGAWSYIGLDNKGIPLHAATLNLGWVDEPVILHEFGHMIGLAHEHSSPAGGIEWNEEAVIKDLSGPPNFWDVDTIRHNVLNKYKVDQIRGTEFDKHSIMLYAFPAAWTKNMPGTSENKDLSELDKAFVRSAEMYPRMEKPENRAVDLHVQATTDAAIGKAGEEDLFRFQVKKPGVHVVETQGSTDVVMSLFGPNSMTRLVATDDDSGEARNARIQATLGEGDYFVRIIHFDPQSTGQYGIRVVAG
jgi:hypothetical protein